MLRFPFQTGARRLIVALTGTGIAAMLLGSVLLLVTQSAAFAKVILIGVVLAGAGFIVIGVATPAPSTAHYEKTGLYLIPAKLEPVQTASKTAMWMGTLAVLLLGAFLSGMGIYGLVKIHAPACV